MKYADLTISEAAAEARRLGVSVEEFVMRVAGVLE